MHGRRFYLVVAVVAAVIATALLTLSPAVEMEAAAPEPTPVVAALLPTVGATESLASASAESVSPEAADVAVGDIKLALVIDRGERWQNIPDDVEARLVELAAAASAGAPEAADDLYMLSQQCNPDAAFVLPRTEQAYTEARDEVIQTHALSPYGHIVGKLENVLKMLEQGFRLCSAFDRLELPGHAHWNLVGIELGSHYAMTMYWKAQAGTGDWEAVQRRGIEYLERARDEGYVLAFYNIGLMRGALTPDGPYTPDDTDALAHFYAMVKIGQAVAAGSADGFTRRLGTLRTRMGRRPIQMLEMRVSPFQMQVARERAEELIDRCCR